MNDFETMTRGARGARRLSLLSSTVLASAIFATALGPSAPARADGGRGGAINGGAGGAGGTATDPTGGAGTAINSSSSGGGGGGVSSSTGFGGDGGLAFGGDGTESGAGDGGRGGDASQVVSGGALAGGTGGAGNSGSNGFDDDEGTRIGGGGGGQGGYGALVKGSGVTNSSTVIGGSGGRGGAVIGGGGGDGGIGVLVTPNNATFTNANGGLVNGGTGGQGGAGSSNGVSGIGGAGVSFTGNNATLINSSNARSLFFQDITGGEGGSGAIGSNGANGGNGVEFLGTNGTFNNMTIDANNGGLVVGGKGGANNADGGLGGAGGAGAFFANGGTVNNQAHASITGGRGGDPGFTNFTGDDDGPTITITTGTGGTGGAGIAGSSLTITNAGTISGGLGGFSDSGKANGGNGGVGILANGATITNRGTIQGGNGGDAFFGTVGAGGIGIVGSNLTIDNAGGTIAGGFAGSSRFPTEALRINEEVVSFAVLAPTGAQAYAIELTGGTNYVGTGGTINGGINVTGNASFMPALPGSAVGTPLAVNGPLMFASTSTYNIRVTPTASDSTAVNGAAALNGAKVAVSAGQGTYQVRQYTILTATEGVNGTFNPNIASNLAFLTPTLSYDANGQAVYLNIQAGTTIAPPVVANNGTLVPNYTSAANTQNQRNVAAGLTNAGVQNGGKGPILNGLNQLTTKQAQAAFDALSGEGITAAQNVANRSTQLFTSSIFDQTTFYSSAPSANSVTLFDPSPIRELADLPSGKFQPTMPVTPNRTWRAWATGYGGVDNIHGDGRIGSAYQQNTIYGGTLGVDYQLTPNYLVGVALGGSNGDFRVASRATSGSTTGGHVAFYDLATFGSFYGASSTSFSYFGNRATRTVSGFGGLNTETERANFNSNEFRSRLEFGRHFAGYGGVLTPFVALELAQLRSNGFTESAVQGAGLFRLNVSGQSQASAPAFVGVRLQRVTSIGNGITISPTLQVAYVHEFAPFRSQIGTIAALPGSTFLVDGARPARNAAQVKAGAEMAMSARSALFVNFDGEFSGVNQLYAGKGGFRYAW